VVSSAVATLRTHVVLVVLLCIVVGICIDEHLWAQALALLKVQATGVAERLEGSGVSSPEGGSRGLAVGTSLHIGVKVGWR
jgi:hypothetical protein